MSSNFGGAGYVAPQQRALTSIANTPNPDISSQEKLVELLQQHSAQIKYLATNQKQLQQGVNDATANPIKQLQQFVADIVVLLGGGELADGLLDFGNLQYILPTLGALFGLGDAPFPIDLFQAAEKFFIGYVVPSQQFVDVINYIIGNWASVFGIDPQFVADVQALITAISELFGGIHNLLPSLNGLFDALGLEGRDLGPLGTVLKPIIKLFSGIDLTNFGDAIEFITDAIDPFIVKLTAVINFLNGVLAVLDHDGDVVNSPLPEMLAPIKKIVDTIKAAFDSFGFLRQRVLPPIHIGRLTNSLPSLEFDSDFDLDPDGDDTAGTWYHDATAGHSAPGSAAIAADGAYHDLPTEQVSVAEKQRYRPSMFVAWESATGTAGSVQLQVREYLDGTLINTVILANATPSGTADFTEVFGTYTVPPGVDAVALAVAVTDGFTAGTVWVDDLTGQPVGLLEMAWVDNLLERWQNIAEIFGLEDVDLDGDIDVDDIWASVPLLAHVRQLLKSPNARPKIAASSIGEFFDNLLDDGDFLNTKAIAGWVHDLTQGFGNGKSRKASATGVLQQLFANEDVIEVSGTDVLRPSLRFKRTSGATGTGTPVQLVLQLYEKVQDAVTGEWSFEETTQHVVEQVSVASISTSSWTELTDDVAVTELPAGTDAVRPVASLTSGFTAGDISVSGGVFNKVQKLPQAFTFGLPDLSAQFNQVRDIFAGLVVTPINTAIQDIKDWWADQVGKTQNLDPGTGKIGVNKVVDTVGDDVQKFIDGFFDKFKRTTGSSGKTVAQVTDAAGDISSEVLTNQVSTETLAGFFNTPRLVPSWLATQADDAAYATTLIDGSTAPTLGQVVLIPVTVTQDRVYDAIKFGIAATTMTNCYVGLYDCDETTGDLTKVIDLGDCKSQLNTSYNQQIIALTDPISVQRGEVYYIGVLQVGGTAAAMHRWSSTQTFTTGLFPRYPGNTYATGSQTALPGSIAVGNVVSGTRFWGALGTVTTPVTPGALTFSDNFNRANGGLGSSWTTRTSSAPKIASNAVESAALSTAAETVATYNSRLSSLSQRVGFSYGYESGTNGAAALLRGSGAGKFVCLYVMGQSSVATARIYTSTAYSPGFTSRDVYTAAGNDPDLLAGNWVFDAVGNVYTGYQNGVQRVQWNDTGGAYATAANYTEVGLIARGTSSDGFLDNWFAQDL